MDQTQDLFVPLSVMLFTNYIIMGITATLGDKTCFDFRLEHRFSLPVDLGPKTVAPSTNYITVIR